MKGKRKLTQRILSLLMVFAMVMGMLLEPVQIYAAQPGEDAGQMKAGPADPQPDGNGGTTDQGGTPSQETEIELEPEHLEIEEGKRDELNAIVTPSDKVSGLKWEIEDESIVSVSTSGDGRATVTALSVGTTEITVKTDDNKSATAQVTVTPKKHVVTVATVKTGKADNEVPIQGVVVTMKDKVTGSIYTAEYKPDTKGYQANCPAGNYTVTCSAKTGFTIEGVPSQDITVNSNGTVDSSANFTMNLNSISINTNNITSLSVKDTAKWSIDKEFNTERENISWEANNKGGGLLSVVEIDNNGTIKALRAGTAIIKATLETEYGTRIATQELEVSKWGTTTSLAVTPSGGNAVESIIATATVKKDNNWERPVTEGTVIFKVYKADVLIDTSEQITVNPMNGTAEHTITGPEFGFSGDYKITAEYMGVDGKFASSNATSESYNFKDVIPMAFENGVDVTQIQEVTYGTTDYMIEVDKEDFIDKAGLSEDEEVTYTYAVAEGSEEVLDVDKEHGKVTFLKASDIPASIMVTRSDIGNHKGVSVEYRFKVFPKEITIDADYSGLTFEKIYDKDYEMFHNEATQDKITGTENIPFIEVGSDNAGIETGDIVSVGLLEGKLPEEFCDVQVDEYGNVVEYSKKADVKLTKVTLKGEDAENYKIDLIAHPINLATKVTINKRTIRMQVANGERQYGHWNEIVYDSKDKVTECTDNYENKAIQGLLNGNKVVFPEPTEVEIPEENKPDYKLGEWTGKLTVYATTNTGEKNGDPTNNYEFDFTDSMIKKGTLTVKEEKIDRSYLDFLVGDGNAYISTNSQIWADSKNEAFHINVDAKVAERYDQVYVKDGLQDIQVDKTVETGGYNFSQGGYKDGDIKILNIYLKNSKNGATSEMIDVEIVMDNENPLLTSITVGEQMHTVEKTLDAITFGKFHNVFSDRIETAVVSDEKGSGVAEWAVNVMQGGQDVDFTGGEIEEHIKAIEHYVDPTNDACKWNIMGTRPDGQDNATLSGTVKIPNKEDNYVVLVKVTDNVGHTKVYSSNGIVVDYTAPKAIIELAEGQVPSSTGIYNDDVKLDIEVFDIPSEDGVKSAVKTVDVVVKNGDKVTQEERLLDIEDYRTEKEDWKLAQLNEFDDNATKYMKKKLPYTVNANKKNNSNNVTVSVIVTDNADNRYEEKFELMFDITPPEIKAEYTSSADVQNGKYYKEPMTATIIYKERNFSDKKQYLWFDVATEQAPLGSYSIDELSGLGITARWENLGKDIQQDTVDTKQLTDERQHKLVLTFDKDNHYVFIPHISDLSEPIAVISGEKQDFVIDRTAPTLLVRYTSEGENLSVPLEEIQRLYKGKSISVSLEIFEHNFADKDKDVQIDVDVKATKIGKNETIPDYNAQAKVNSKWGTNGDSHTITYTFNADANYTHSIQYKDLAGNELEVPYGPGYFTVDKTQPTGTVEIKGFGFWESLLEKITFGLFSPSTVDVVMTGADHTSPVNPVQFARFHDQMTRDDLENYNGWSSASQEKPESAAFSVSPDEQFIVYTKVTDYAGNYQYFSSDGMIVDSTKPAPVVTITNLSQAQNGIFNENVTLQIDVEDPTAGETYSGLEKVWYTVSAAGNVTTSETIELLNNGGNKVQGNKIFSKVITVPADVYNSNDVKVQAFATDFSGNQGDSEVTELKIDVTNPTISVSWDLNNPLNGRYYKDTRTATVTVTDRNFDPNNVRFSITNTDGTSANISGWSSSSNIGVSDTATSTCQVSFPADGDYTFTLGCTDLAGNSGEYRQTDEFTIDKTIPVMTVSYDNNNARNGNFFKETRTATVTIREHNFNAADVRAAITASLEGSGISTPSISGFSGSGDVHTATVNYSTDGDYTFDIDYTDMAGNAAADYTQDSFTVDLTAPELEITDVEDKSANNDAVAPKVEATDVNYDAKGVTMTLTGANNGNVEVGKVVSAIQNGQSMKFNDFARTEEMDDLYKLQAKTVDKAGNETQKEIMFSVNRYGSVFILDNDTKDWLKTGDEGYTYIREEKEVGIREINVDAIESRSITVNRDGDLASLKENTDFTVKNSGSDAQWKEAHYVIAKNNFEEEGNYTVILNTQDKAQNSMNNTSVKKANKNLPIEFAVDKTAPTVVVSGVEDDAQYRAAERTMIVDAKDNLALTKVSISIDGEKIVYDGEELLKDNGVIETTVASANRWQNIEITAEDAAGNVLGQSEKAQEGEPVVLHVLVTPNIVIQYYMNKPLFYGSIVAIVIMAGLIIFLVAKKKKDRSEYL